MLHKSVGRAIAAAVMVCAPLLAGDYDHVFDVVRDVWPERNVAMAICDKDANQMALLDLADSAKAHNLSLVIMDLRSEKEYNKTIIAALQHNPGFFLIIDEDPLMGSKGSLTARMTYRVGGKDIPAVGVSAAALKQGAVLTAGPGADDPVFVNKAAAKRMKLLLPSGAVDPAEGKGK